MNGDLYPAVACLASSDSIELVECDILSKIEATNNEEVAPGIDIEGFAFDPNKAGPKIELNNDNKKIDIKVIWNLENSKLD